MSAKPDATDLSDCDDAFLDSGVILSSADVDVDSGLLLPSSSDDLKTESSRLDSGVDVGSKRSEPTIDSGVDVGIALTESFGELTLRNDLGSEEREDSPERIETEPEPWQIYYRQDDDGDTQLHIAIIHGLEDAVQALIHMCPHPALLDIKNDSGRSPIHLAVLTSQPHIARRLLIAGAKVNTRDAEGNTALHLASSNGDLNSLIALTIPFVPQHSYPSLHQSRARTLPQALDQKNYDGEACVHLAAMGGHVDILKHLVWFGADINARENKSGRTPLHIAIESGNVEVLKYLITGCSHILSLGTRTYSGHTALQLSSPAIKEELLAAGYVRQEDESDFETDESSDDEDDDDGFEYSDNRNFFNTSMRTGEPINVA